MISDYFSLCRPIHAVKNLLIVLPPFFGHMINDWSMIGVVPAILSFSMIASAVYILNDLMDYEKDKCHPVKKKRAVASGKVSKSAALFIFAALLLSGFLLMLVVSRSCYTILIALIYFVINVAYSWKLKHFPICDIFTLAVGFVLRIYFGGIWFHIAISPWLFLCVLSGALCFATGKRRNELRQIAPMAATRSVLHSYTDGFLTASYYLFCGITIVFFALWVILANQCGWILMISIPVVMLIMLRYNLILETCENDGDPVPTLVKDRFLIALVIVFFALNFCGVYCS